jgi:hypothetical protein
MSGAASSSYLQQREENIRRNAEKLKELGLADEVERAAAEKVSAR